MCFIRRIKYNQPSGALPWRSSDALWRLPSDLLPHRRAYEAHKVVTLFSDVFERVGRTDFYRFSIDWITGMSLALLPHTVLWAQYYFFSRPYIVYIFTSYCNFIISHGPNKKDSRAGCASCSSPRYTIGYIGYYSYFCYYDYHGYLCYYDYRGYFGYHSFEVDGNLLGVVADYILYTTKKKSKQFKL